ncbi:hypothetical protein SLEP1_g19521 [Rubroshorea leprosula]|uniref:Cytochrome P450 n=1 Tax=Rubroshorea leprosula TaxID=152421 RepID=A0AAV5JAA1_9ROSI|nr:hypothetical protein SLEP1_g19521 [Rubroshorea leprosula]
MVGFKEILVAVVLSFIFLVHWSWNRNSPVRIWPVVGMLPGVLHNIGRLHDFFTEVLERGKGTLQVRGPWFSNLNFVLTSDSRNVQHILSKKFENFQRGPEFREIFEALGDGIFNSDGDLWKTQQKSLHSLIKNTKFELAVQRILSQKLERGLIPILESCSVLDMQDVFHRLTFDVICLLVLGFDPNCLSIEFPNVSCEKAYDVMEEAALYRHFVPTGFWKLQRLLQVGEENKLRRAWETFDKFLYDQILLKHEKLSTKNAGKEEEFDLLTAFMLGESGEKSNRFWRDTAFSLLAAGRDTVAAALVWFLWLVATHPSVEEKILEEIKVKNMHTNEDSKWKIYSVKEMSQLVYLHGAISEALRLYPPVPFEHRASVQPDILPSGHPVGRNTKIFLSLYSMGRSKEIWGEDCLEFKPERWISEQGGVVHIPSYKFMPFLTGPRTCLGKDTAFYQIKTVAVAVIQNYHVKVLENHPVTPSPSIILKMKHGLLVRLSKRHH